MEKKLVDCILAACQLVLVQVLVLVLDLPGSTLLRFGSVSVHFLDWTPSVCSISSVIFLYFT